MQNTTNLRHHPTQHDIGAGDADDAGKYFREGLLALRQRTGCTRAEQAASEPSDDEESDELPINLDPAVDGERTG